MGGGGGGGTNTVQNSNAFIPGWLENAGQTAVDRANWLSQQPYNPYTGQTVAGFDPAQLQAYGAVNTLQGMGAPTGNANISNLMRVQQQAQNQPFTNPDIQAATDVGWSNYQNNVWQPAQGLLSPYTSLGPATAQGVGAGAQQLMSPYTQSVIDPANRLMQQQLGQNLGTIGAAANQAGAFGGSRQGVMEGVAQSQAALGSEKYLGDMLNNQWGNALNMSGSIADRNAQLGYSANKALSDMLGTGYNQQQRLAYDIASGNAQNALQAGQLVPGALSAQNRDIMSQISALNAAGQMGQQQQQNILNAAQGGWQQAQDYPYQQLQMLLGALGSIPYSTSNTSQSMDWSQMYSNPYGQAIGGAAALAGGVGSILNSNAAGNA